MNPYTVLLLVLTQGSDNYLERQTATQALNQMTIAQGIIQDYRPYFLLGCRHGDREIAHRSAPLFEKACVNQLWIYRDLYDINVGHMKGYELWGQEHWGSDFVTSEWHGGVEAKIIFRRKTTGEYIHEMSCYTPAQICALLEWRICFAGPYQPR
jgi:hypothetical protein